MSEATTKNIGKFITGSEYRDAVHISVAPVLCAENLCAAAPVKMVAPNVVAFCEGDESIGIIDPYIKEPIPKGTWVYIFMYMNTIHDLHHEWNHPAFSEKVPVKVDKAKAMKSWEEPEKGLSSLKAIKWSMPAAPLGTAKTKVAGEWVNEWEKGLLSSKDIKWSLPATPLGTEIKKKAAHEAAHKEKETMIEGWESIKLEDIDDDCKNCY